MTVKELTENLELKIINEGDLSKDVTGIYCCDLMSVVMSKASAGDAWITVMGNVNAVAVSVLTDISCVIIAHGMDIDEAAINKAKLQDVTILMSEKPIYECACDIGNLI